jgi:hypothetical protein
MENGQCLMLLGFFLFQTISYSQPAKKDIINTDYYLIAHRGGVVEGDIPENSLEALKKAADRGYWMVEVDMRLTQDSIFITQHDNSFNRYFGVDKKVTDMTWSEIKKLKTQSGSKVQKLEDVLRFCAKNNLNVMIDNKVRGNDTVLFTKVVSMLDKYDLIKNALMIGTDESTEFFTGKISLSCTIEQLKNNIHRQDYQPSNYYLFAYPSKEDVVWAGNNNILTIGVINAWPIPEEQLMEEAGKKVEYLKSIGIKHFQIDSKFDVFFRNR